jgi:hypothetical protein
LFAFIPYPKEAGISHSLRFAAFASPHQRLRRRGFLLTNLVKLLEFLIQTYTEVGDLVLDCFAGSGSTLVAAAHTGRRAIGVEINPGYCQVAEEWLQRDAEGLPPPRRKDAKGKEC